MPRMVRFVLIAFWLACPAALSADPKAKPPGDSAVPAEHSAVKLTVESIQRRLKQVENAANLDESLRKSLIERYTAAIEHLRTADEHAAKAAEFRKATEEAPQELEILKAELESPASVALPRVSPEMGLSEMQQALSEAEEAYEGLQKQLAELEAEPARRASRRVEIPELQVSVKKQIDEIGKLSESNPAAGAASDPGLVAERVLISARRHALEHELQVYEEELRHYELTVDLIEARRDHAVLETEHVQRHVKTWMSAVNERRRREAQEQVETSREAARHAHPAMRRLANESARLAAQRQDLAARLEIATKEVETLQDQLVVLESLFKRVKDRVKRVGLTESIGLLLRKQRDGIPDPAEHQRFIDEREAEISRLSLQSLSLEDQREALADIDRRSEQIRAEMQAARKSKQAPSSAEIREVLEAMRGYLDALIADTNSYIDVLSKLDGKEAQLVVQAREFSKYANEYILWIRSAELPHAGDAVQLRDAASWLIAPRHWSAAIETFVRDVRAHPVAYLAILVAVLALTLSQRFWRNLLRRAGRGAAGHHAISIQPTARALVATFFLSAVWPAAVWLVGWRLSHLAARSEFLTALGRAIEGVALLLATFNFTRHLCRSLGLGESHFDWPLQGLKLVRGSIWRLTVVGLPLAAIVLMTESQGDEAIKNSAGRAAFIALQVLLLASAHQVWHGSHGLARSLAAGEPDRWWLRLCRLAHVASVVAPVALAALAIVGYYYTAVQLAQRMVVSVWLIGGLLVLHATLLRWLLLAYRDLSMKRSREQRAADAARSAADRLTDGAGSQPTVRLSDINLQTHKLLGLAFCGAFLIGCSVIWVEVLPALAILDTVQLWPRLAII